MATKKSDKPRKIPASLSARRKEIIQEVLKERMERPSVSLEEILQWREEGRS